MGVLDRAGEESAVLIDILLPTYRRPAYLSRNLENLSNLVHQEGQGLCSIAVSDDASPDETWAVIQEFERKQLVPLKAYHQETNLGLDGNVVFLLKQATAPYVLFVGEDDFLPEGYLSFCIETLKQDPTTSAVFPGILSKRTDGRVRDARVERFDVRRYPGGRKAAWQVGYLGYQMSGLLLKREGLFEVYTADQSLRNLHLFNTFALYNTLRGTSYFAPKYKVLVTTGNKKYWSYDQIGLLGDIYKNFQIVFPGEKRWQNRLFIRAVSKQKWKIGVHRGRWIDWHLLKNLAQSIPMDFDLVARLVLFFGITFFEVQWEQVNLFFFRVQRRLQKGA